MNEKEQRECGLVLIDILLKNYGPERSKREEPCCKRFYVEYSPEFKAHGLKDGYENLKADGMRCSEHCGNTVSEVQ